MACVPLILEFGFLHRYPNLEQPLSRGFTRTSTLTNHLPVFRRYKEASLGYEECGSVLVLRPVLMFLFDFRGEDVVFTRALFHSAHYVLAVPSSLINYKSAWVWFNLSLTV